MGSVEDSNALEGWEKLVGRIGGAWLRCESGGWFGEERKTLMVVFEINDS